MTVTSALQALAPAAAAFGAVMQPFMVPLAGMIGWGIIAAMKRHGYQTVYATAIMRGFGAGVAAAQAKGLDPFSPAGRSVVIAAGAQYMNENVGQAAAALGISSIEDHERRLSAQIGAVQGQAEALASAQSRLLVDVPSEVTSQLKG